MISALVLVPGIIALARFGLRPSVDFTGGTLLEVVAPGVSSAGVEGVARDAGLKGVHVVKTEPDTYLVRMRPASQSEADDFQLRLASASAQPLTLLREETVGPTLGAELLRKAVFAAVLAILAILIYVAYAFRSIKFGVSAVAALIHDLLVVVGVFALLGHFRQVEVDTLFVTAVLTTMSFSVHDTIVVFDRVREHRKKDQRTPLRDVADLALTETMNRSLINSMTILFMLVALILMGGDTTKWFVAALLVGTISGTYSSPFVATPILILWDQWQDRKKS